MLYKVPDAQLSYLADATAASGCSLPESWERQRWRETPRRWFTVVEVHEKRPPAAGAVTFGPLRSLPVLSLLPAVVVLNPRLQGHQSTAADGVVVSLPSRKALRRDPLIARITSKVGGASLTFLKRVVENITWTSSYYYCCCWTTREQTGYSRHT